MKVVLCVTGSVAAIETVKLVRELRRQDYEVKCFMSDGACDIIHPYALEFASGQQVVSNLTGDIEHVKYATSDLIIVAPATANVISKFAYRIADNPINTLLVTAKGYETPILFVPSMHQSMYNAVEENIHKLKNEGISFVEPLKEENKAKFPSKEDIILHIKRELNKQDLKSKRVLISAGGTYEAIDEVRGITNRSSGKMGIELAKDAFIRGADVTLLLGKVEIKVPSLFKQVKVESTADMAMELETLLPDFDIFISAAAVSDFTPQSNIATKISSNQELNLKLVPTLKLINKVKKINPNIFLVGFKATYGLSEEEMVLKARERMLKSHADLIVANDLAVEGSGFGSDLNEINIISSDQTKKVPLTSKSEAARQIIDHIVKLMV